MMLPVSGPTTSLMEDLNVLGLVEGENKEPSAASNKKGAGYAKPDDQGGDFAGPPPMGEGGHYKEGDFAVPAGDKAAGERRNVPVRSGGLNRTSVGPDAANPALNQDTWDDVDTDDVVAESGKMVPAFLIPSEAEVMEAEEEAQAIAEEEQLERAWQVVYSYFTEDEDGLNEDGLRGVCNAMGFALNTAVEDIANLTLENERLAEANSELTNLLRDAEAGLYEGDYGKDDDEDEDEDDKLPSFLKKMKKKKDDYEESYGRRANLIESTELASLASELSTLGESRATRAIDAQSGLIEAYEKIRDDSAEIVEAIIDVLLQDADLAEGEELEVDEADERVQIARFFESITDDANRYLSRLTDGDVPFAVADADLGKLRTDMERGIDAMHSVE